MCSLVPHAPHVTHFHSTRVFFLGEFRFLLFFLIAPNYLPFVSSFASSSGAQIVQNYCSSSV